MVECKFQFKCATLQFKSTVFQFYRRPESFTWPKAFWSALCHHLQIHLVSLPKPLYPSPAGFLLHYADAVPLLGMVALLYTSTFSPNKLLLILQNPVSLPLISLPWHHYRYLYNILYKNLIPFPQLMIRYSSLFLFDYLYSPLELICFSLLKLLLLFPDPSQVHIVGFQKYMVNK